MKDNEKEAHSDQETGRDAIKKAGIGIARFSAAILISSFSVSLFAYALHDFDGQVLEKACNDISIKDRILKDRRQSNESEEEILKAEENLESVVSIYKTRMDDIEINNNDGSLKDVSERVKSHLVDHSCHQYWDRV